MTYGHGGQPPWEDQEYAPQDYGRRYPQDQTWQPPRYDFAAHQRRLQGGPQQQWQPDYNQPYPGPPQFEPPPYPAQPYAPQPGYPPAARPPRRRRRVFMWVFLAIQALFIVWIIAGVASHPSGPSSATQAAQQCANGGWQDLFKSEADCRQHYAVALDDATNVGKGIGVAFIVVFWCVVDFLIGVTYLIVWLARRRT